MAYENMKSWAKSDSTGRFYMSLEDLGRYKSFRKAECQAKHPETFSFPLKDQIAAGAESAILYHLFSDDSKKIRMDWLDVFFKEERLPFDLEWDPRPVSNLKLVKLVSEILYYANKKTHGCDQSYSHASGF